MIKRFYFTKPIYSNYYNEIFWILNYGYTCISINYINNLGFAENIMSDPQDLQGMTEGLDRASRTVELEMNFS